MKLRTIRQRRWRSQKAQVSAVATILSLLVVVSFVANYLATQLPAQMDINDVTHELAVIDQVGRLQALMQLYGEQLDSRATITQPISLGSAADPPFGQADSASIIPGAAGSALQANFTLAGAVAYNPPGGWAAGGGSFGSCTVTPSGNPNPTSVSCSGGVTINHNFTNGSHSITISGGATLTLKFQANDSTEAVTTSSTSTENLEFVGSHDTITLTASGGANVHMTVLGSNNTISFPASGGSTYYILLVGNNDVVTQGSSGGTTILISAWGSGDSFSATTSGGATIAVHYTGFNADNPTSSTCPYGNLTSSDTVSETSSGGGTFTVSYNNTGYSNTGSSGGWTQTWTKETGLTCPFYSAAQIPTASSASSVTSLVVALRNTYSPPAEVAYDAGAVVLAQTGGVPVIVDPPAIDYDAGALTLFLPQFETAFGDEAGIDTADLTVQVVSSETITLPGDGLSLEPGTDVTVTIATQYAAAWVTYLDSNPAYSGHISCAGGALACSGLFVPGGPIGTVTLSLPATSLTLTVAEFSVLLD